MTVFVGPSIWRNMDVRTATAMFGSMASNPTDERVIWAPLWNDALIGRSRSIMCTEFLKTDADVMVIVDDDVVWEPEDFWKIIEGARETRGVYGGAYVTRSTTPHISSRSFPNTGEQVFARTPMRRPVEYQYLATGFWAVHRDVMEAMIAGTFEDAFGTHTIPLVELGADRPFYPFFSPFVCREYDGKLHYLSEDWAFSNRARQLGFKVWVDLSIVLIHMGWYPFTVRDLNDREEGLPSTGIDRLEMQGVSTATGDPLIDNLIVDIAEFAGEPVGDVRRMCQQEVAVETMNRLWNERTVSEEDWYRREDVGAAYIADIASWHLRGGGAPAELAEGLAGKRLLDFGGGIGTWALRAARAGASVDVVETNPVLRAFIEFRANKYGLGVTVRESDMPGIYDAVSCWHVFEHLAKPEAVLDELMAALTPDGSFITDSGFNDATTACHHVRSDWEDVLATRGLVKERDGVYRLQPVAVPA